MGWDEEKIDERGDGPVTEVVHGEAARTTAVLSSSQHRVPNLASANVIFK